MTCLFCRILAGEVAAHRAWEDEDTVAFLDHRPLFPGHLLVVPRLHVETLADLPSARLEPLFRAVRLLSAAVPEAMEAEGSFVAINNKVSQSVPHLHVHVAPRRRKDGLKGFFWPRTRYAGEEEMAETARRIAEAAARWAATPGPG